MILQDIPFIAELIALRRDIHAHPELAFEEVRTSDLVAELLESWGIPTHRGMGITGVVGIIHGNVKNGRAIGLRADMDALPMQDEKDVPYRSQVPGVCHACGHDGHTAALLGAAKYCAAHRDQLCGTIKFVFQPAEEGPAPGGAKYIVESGVLDESAGLPSCLWYIGGRVDYFRRVQARKHYFFRQAD